MQLVMMSLELCLEHWLQRGRNIYLVQHKTWMLLLKKQKKFNLKFRVIFMKDWNFQKLFMIKNSIIDFPNFFFRLVQVQGCRKYIEMPENNPGCLYMWDTFPVCLDSHKSWPAYIHFLISGVNYTALYIEIKTLALYIYIFFFM